MLMWMRMKEKISHKNCLKNGHKKKKLSQKMTKKLQIWQTNCVEKVHPLNEDEENNSN